jgi:hypothetical protein
VQERPIARKAEGGDRIERLHHDGEILRTELLVDELIQGIANAIGSGTRADVELIEKKREHAGAGLPGRPLLVARILDRRRFRFARERPEFNSLQRLRDAVLQKLEIGGLKIENRAPLGVGHDRIDADSIAIVLCLGWLLLPGEHGQPAHRKQVRREEGRAAPPPDAEKPGHVSV